MDGRAQDQIPEEKYRPGDPPMEIQKQPTNKANEARSHSFKLDEHQEFSVNFPFGLPGFEHLHQYHIHALADYPHFVLMTSDEEDQVTMLLIHANALEVQDRLKIPNRKLQHHSLTPGDVSAIYVVLRLHPDTRRLTANLRAPVVVDQSREIGYQIILDDETLPTSFPIITIDEKNTDTESGESSATIQDEDQAQTSRGE